MTDFEQVAAMFDRAKQPHFEYCQVGDSGSLKVMVLDDHGDGSRIVPLLCFDLDTGAFIAASLRHLDP